MVKRGRTYGMNADTVFRAAKAIKTAAQAYRVATASGTQTQYDAGGRKTVSAQKDNALIYRRKKMPRRKKKAWRRFKKRTNYVVQTQKPKSFTVMQNKGQQTVTASQLLTTPTGLQRTEVFSNFTCNGSAGQDDLKVIGQLNASVANPSLADYLSVKGCNNTITLSNRTTTDGEVLVDLYYGYYTRDVGKEWNGVEYQTVNAILGAWATSNTTEVVVGNSINAQNYGWTPFQAKEAAKYMKITRKTRHIIPDGDILTITLNESKFRRMDLRSLEEKLALKGSKFVIAIFWSAPSSLDNEDFTAAMDIKYTSSRRYFYYNTADNEQKKSLISDGT